jgi:hypothetical protein
MNYHGLQARAGIAALTNRASAQKRCGVVLFFSQKPVFETINFYNFISDKEYGFPLCTLCAS